jgi:hypothetical protein
VVTLASFAARALRGNIARPCAESWRVRPPVPRTGSPRSCRGRNALEAEAQVEAARGGRGGERIAPAYAQGAARGLSAQPVRRWVAAQWPRLTAPVPAAPPATGRARAPTLPQPVAGVAPSTFTVTFALEPGPGPFTVAFDARPAGGTLRVTTDGARRGRRARAGDRDGGDERHATHARRGRHGDGAAGPRPRVRAPLMQ